MSRSSTTTSAWGRTARSALPNYFGIALTSTSPNTVGGTLINQNVISGNTQVGIDLGNAGSTGTIITGNVIGLNAAKTTKVANGSAGIFVYGPNTVVGGDGTGLGTTGGSGNVIAGNNNAGINVVTGATGSQILGNYIGTNETGDANLGNIGTGVQVLNVSNITVGSITGTGRNVIVSNGNNGTDTATDGIIVFSSTAAVTGVQIVNNYVGVAADGVTARPNYHGIGFNSTGGFTITGTLIDKNVISGNTANGINLGNGFNVGTVITGNTIGLNASRSAAVAQRQRGHLRQRAQRRDWRHHGRRRQRHRRQRQGRRSSSVPVATAVRCSGI